MLPPCCASAARFLLTAPLLRWPGAAGASPATPVAMVRTHAGASRCRSESSPLPAPPCWRWAPPLRRGPRRRRAPPPRPAPPPSRAPPPPPAIPPPPPAQPAPPAQRGIPAQPGTAPSDKASHWPSKPVTLVIPYPPGGSSDIVGRQLADRLREELGQTIVVENKAGAATTIGATAVARAAKDGHTLLLSAGSTFTVAPHL